MGGRSRAQMLMAGKVLLVGVLALTSIATIASSRFGWTNYWGGLVYAPFALLVAGLFAVALMKKRDVGERRSAPRRKKA